MEKFPSNLALLHSGQLALRDQSVKVIENDEDLLMHLTMIELAMDTFQFFRQFYDEVTEAQKAVKLLSARLFNSTAAALDLILIGYCQAATVHTRDVLETSFLLDYFSTDEALVDRWAKVSEAERTKEFSQFKIRTALDARDGYTSKKRHEHYRLLSSMGAHPSYEGLGMLWPSGNDLAMMGPFFSAPLMKGSIEELVKVSQLSIDAVQPFFPAQNAQHMRAFVARTEARASWFARFFGADRSKQLEEMRKAAASIEELLAGHR